MRTRVMIGLAALVAGTVGACGGGSRQAAGSRRTTTTTAASPTSPTPVTPVAPTTTQTPQAARANARCLVGNDAVSAILGAPYGPPRLQPSGAGKVCRYEAANGSGYVVITLRLAVTADDFNADRQPFNLAGTPTKDWSGVGDQGFTDVNPAEHSATAGALEGNAEVLASAIGAGSLANAEDLVRAAIAALVTGA
jgi:hypothetical protein